MNSLIKICTKNEFKNLLGYIFENFKEKININSIIYWTYYSCTHSLYRIVCTLRDEWINQRSLSLTESDTIKLVEKIWNNTDYDWYSKSNISTTSCHPTNEEIINFINDKNEWRLKTKWLDISIKKDGDNYIVDPYELLKKSLRFDIDDALKELIETGKMTKNDNDFDQIKNKFNK